jgi:hypothetical protein
MTTGLLRHPLPFPLSVEAAFGALDQGQDHALWLDDHGERGSGVSYVAFPTALSPEQWASSTGRSAALGQYSEPSPELGSLPLGVFFVLPYEAGHTFVGIDSALRSPDTRALGGQAGGDRPSHGGERAVGARGPVVGRNRTVA